MCGIVAKINFGKNKKTPVNNDILQQFDKQSHRGRQGFGLFDGQYMHIIRESREDAILKWLVEKDSNFIIFHHRFPTSTVNVARAAHPFSTKDYFGDTQYIMVHNGVIRNADDLWVDHNNLGIKYSSLLDDLSFNDSEALMWDLALTMEGKQDKPKAYGDIAFIMVKKVKGKIVDVRYGRNSRPLNVFRDDGTLELSSEGQGVSILSNTLYIWDYKSNEVTKQDFTLSQYRPYSGTYSHHHQTSLLSSYPAPTPHCISGDYDSYDEWYEARYGVKRPANPVVDRESNWQRLRAKYGKKLGGKVLSATDENAGELAKDIIQVLGSAGAYSVNAILTDKGKLLPAEIKHAEAIDVSQLDLRDYEPTTAEVQNVAMDYMIEAQGVFETAYMLLEEDYADRMSEVYGKETFDDIRNQLLMEKALEFINKDPEYENENSVSSIWEALWFQNEMTYQDSNPR